jgi:tetratricopeptide (TPR) repeat protein
MLAVAAYLQALNYPFVSDDSIYITENTKLGGLRFTDMWHLFIEPYNQYEFLPLRDLSFWFDMTLFGLTPSAFRVHNIILYVICLPLVYATTLGIWQYFRPADTTSERWAAAAVTALFAVHPAHVEAVVWISGRKDVLSGLFSLLALWLAVNSRREQGFSSFYAAATIIALLAAMLSKATTVVVAPVICILWIIFWLDIPKQKRHHLHLLWSLISLLLAACVALIFTGNSTIKEPAYFGIETLTRLMAILGWLARLSISPENRHLFYPVFEDMHFSAMVAGGAAVLAAAIASMVMVIRHRSLEGFSLVIFVLICIPYLQLIPYLTSSLVSDRFLYLAAWPVTLLVIALAWRLRLILRVFLLLVIAGSWSFQSIERSRDWRSYEALVDADLRAYPRYFMPVFQKVTIQMGLRKYQDAIEITGHMSDLDIRNVTMKMIEATYEVRIIAEKIGKSDEAMHTLQNFGLLLKQEPEQLRWNSAVAYVWHYARSILSKQWGHLIQQFPDDELVRYRAGVWALEVHNYEEAVMHLRTVTESQDIQEFVRGSAFKNYGAALLNNGHAAEAEAPLLAALEQLPPDFQAYCLLSDVYKRTNRLEKVAHAEAACRSHLIEKIVQ